MVRAKQNPTPITERRNAESKPNKAVVNTRSPNRVLSKIKPSKVTNANVVNSSESAKEIAIDDNDKPSNTSQQTGNSVNVKKTVTSTNSTSAGISKMSDVLINKQGVSKVAISKTASTVSTNSNASVAQKIALPRLLPTTAAPPPKYVFIKIDRPPRIFEQLRTVRTATGCYVSVPNVTSTPTVSQKDKSIVSNVQQTDQSKSKNILSALLQSDKNKNTESSIQQKEQNKINNPNILQKDQSPNAVQNTQPSDQDVSTVENDQSSNTKQSNVEKIQSEILNSKFLPIKPKPPGYQVLLLSLLNFSIYIVKIKILSHN